MRTVLRSMSLLALIILMANITHAQNVYEIMQDKDLNYYEKIDMIEDESKGLKDNASTGELKRYMRWRRFWDTRIDENGEYKTAHRAMKKHFEESQSGKTSGTGNKWQHIETSNMATYEHYKEGKIGRVECLWSDPNNSDIVFAGTSTTGLWKTTDGGDNWVCLTEDVPGASATDVVVNPSNHNEIYISTGIHMNPMSYKHYSLGLMKTTDGGATWTTDLSIAPQDENPIRKMIMEPGGSTLYVLTEKNLALATQTCQRAKLLAAFRQHLAHRERVRPNSKASRRWPVGRSVYCS